MMIARITLITVLLAILGVGSLSAQTGYEERRKELLKKQENTRQEIESLEEQIHTYRNRLEVTTEQYEEVYRQFEELTRMISLQDEKIRRLQAEQQQVAREITLVEENLEELETELKRLIDQYKTTLTYLYKHGRTTEMALILTSASINQLLVRSYYLAKFDEHRKIQEQEIRETQDNLETARIDLELTQERNNEILAEIQHEKQQLSQKKEQQKESIETLQRDRNKWRNQLNLVEQQRSQLNETLTSLIDEEERIRAAEEERLRQLAAARQIEDENEREEAIARYSRPSARSGMVSEEELNAYEISFGDAKGQLPWPVDGGTITENFGVRVHPVFNTRTQNLGVEIAVPSESQVRAVHDGYVFAVQPLPGYGDMVMVSHGRYKTVYGNLSDIFVSRGNILRQGDIIGLSGNEDSIRGEVLFFLIRNGTQDVNPEAWIQRTTP
ncbi:MAG: peptidoglycan DD-metalloendopeptidase family protein [Balneolaceae bacterium]